MPSYADMPFRQRSMPVEYLRPLARWLFLAGLIYATSVLAPRKAHAHDSWSDGNHVPAWVKAACCGPEDVHHLTAKQVHAMTDGWHVDGYKQVLAYGRELPSQDGDYWIFYRDLPDGSQTPVYCFFAPSQSY
jgi:hypothetical protein